jgi:hypothetical protein
MKSSALNIGIVFAMLASGCIFVHRPLINPEVNIPDTVPQDRVKQSVYQALTHYGWVIEDKKPGATTAHLQQNQLYARVEVDYDRTHATVRYLESKNFYHAKSASGDEYIHSRYLVWARNIAEKINNDLNPKPPSTPAAESPR